MARCDMCCCWRKTATSRPVHVPQLLEPTCPLAPASCMTYQPCTAAALLFCEYQLCEISWPSHMLVTKSTLIKERMHIVNCQFVKHERRPNQVDELLLNFRISQPSTISDITL